MKLIFLNKPHEIVKALQNNL